jgi:hypothetical protein
MAGALQASGRRIYFFGALGGLLFGYDGHDALTSLNQCLVGNPLAYLEAGVLPPEGASCDREPPFAGG